MGRLLGWSRRRRAAETRRYLDLVEAEPTGARGGFGPGARPGPRRGEMNQQGSRRLLTFRLDQEQRQRLRARLAREGRTMSEVVTNGLRQYVQPARHPQRPGDPAACRCCPSG